MSNWAIEDNLYKKYLNYTPSGSQEKMEVTIQGRKGVFKLPQHPKSHDAFVEEFCYLLARQFGVNHCVQRQCSYKGNAGVFSEYATRELTSIMSLEEFLKTDTPSTPYHIFHAFQKCGTEEDYAKTVIFDLVTRQIDRNTGNLYVYRYGLDVYPLFDCGLSLFSTFEDEAVEAKIDTVNFQMRYGLSRDYFFSVPAELRRKILSGFNFDMRTVVNDCYIPDTVTPYRLYFMEYWISNMIRYMEANS